MCRVWLVARRAVVLRHVAEGKGQIVCLARALGGGSGKE